MKHIIMETLKEIGLDMLPVNHYEELGWVIEFPRGNQTDEQLVQLMVKVSCAFSSKDDIDMEPKINLTTPVHDHGFIVANPYVFFVKN